MLPDTSQPRTGPVWWQGGPGVALALLVMAVLGAACTPAAETRLADSRSPVLVPTDEAFRPEFRFTLNVAPEIYDVFTNVDAEFNADIDKSLGVQGWQINDLATWYEQTPGESERDRELLAEVVRSAIAAADGDASCTTIDAPTATYSCGPSGTPFVARFLGEPGTTPLLLVPDIGAARRYATQRFEHVSLDRADPWFTTSNP